MTATALTPEHTINRWVLQLASGLNGTPSPSIASLQRLSPSHRPALYRFDNDVSLVLKEYWRDSDCDPALALLRARREAERFALCHELELCRNPDRTARMLESRSEPPAALALEYVQGVNLGSLIRRGLKKSLNPSPPFSAATAVARCLAHIHSVSTPRIGITSSCEETYPDKIIETLGGLTGGKVRPLALLLRSARERLSLSSDRLVHGDANPTNFIVEPSGTAVAIDLERLGRGDPHLDIGFLLADFIHMASHCGQPKAAAELAEAFRAAYKPPIDSARERYFTALGLLRIARNPWHTPFHRDWLIARAERLLSA